MRLSVAIDGPAGAGKSTIAKLVAKEFDLMYINTGAMYRAVALKAEENNIGDKDIDALCSLISTFEMKFENDDLILNGENIQDRITMPEISKIVSKYASIKEVREILVKLQREMSNKFDVIMDGRDIGTVVLKDSKFKFFLTATPEARAERRYKELTNRGLDVDYSTILEDIIKRDYLDSNREVDPLKKADDAIEVDTTKLSINEVVKEISLSIKKNLSVL
ncbi:(d)CMP kinase [Clostridium sartagoforme]|uniref:Cytidylate kinase n=1 Tax=Clostridium sartagoforme TaxID=84031 RepID=A0A4S2DP02_9CLOT|nr:(d)CMP kinase [Clostridium sartagoforme]TGY44137.1 (d)CMP kinase [Clostridium sartagoforme]